MSSLRNARFSYYGGGLSPMQELEAKEMSRHMAQRAEALARMGNQRFVAARKAIERGEPFPSGRYRAQKRAEKVRRANADALAQPITYLPSLPAAAELAARTWARDSYTTGAEVAEAKSMVEALSDDLGTLTTVISAWVRPDMQKQWLGALKGKTNDAKGVAPQSRHFKLISEVPKRDAPGQRLQPYEQPPPDIPPYSGPR